MRQPEQQKRTKTIQFRVTPHIADCIKRVAWLRQENVGSLFWRIARAFDQGHVTGKSDIWRGYNKVEVVTNVCVECLSYDPQMTEEEALQKFRGQRLKRPLDETRDKLYDRLLKIWTPDLAKDFWNRQHPDLSGLSPSDALQRYGFDRVKEIDRLIRYYERIAKKRAA